MYNPLDVLLPLALANPLDELLRPAKSVHFRSEVQDWRTPKDFFDRCEAAFGPFTVDAAASKWNARKARFWTVDDDCLSFPWMDESAWLNPEYGRKIGGFLGHAAKQTTSDVVALVPARTDTAWFSDHVLRWAAQIVFVRGRMQFERPDGAKAGAPFPSCVVVYRKGRVRRHEGDLPDVAWWRAR
jgi:site-specific DNA-methyltransferase (adenine-specific)